MAKTLSKRYSGVLAHPTSFPSPYGIGDFGKGAYDFINFLTGAGQSLWQILPLGHTGYGDSPYQAFSAFAGQPLLISPDELIKDGLLYGDDLRNYPHFNPDHIYYGDVIPAKLRILHRSYEIFKESADLCMLKEFDVFCEHEKDWLDDYALFMAGKDAHGGACWLEWEDDLRDPDEEIKAAWRERLADSIEYYKYIQFIFFRQWNAIRDYAHVNGIKIVGDIPIYVALDSADVWSHPELFQLDEENLTPLKVSGVPPDAFSEDGQLWGNPLYDWEKMEQTDFAWWRSRMKASAKLYDAVRIDHFIGVVQYYAIPYGAVTAKDGEWEKGPGKKLTDALDEAAGETKIIAEDLGVFCQEVKDLLAETGYPGMKIIEFAFSGDRFNEHLPHCYDPNSVVYGGTHDNETLAGYFKPEKRQWWELQYIADYLGAAHQSEVVDRVFRAAYGSVASVAIFQMQDVLKLDNWARMNTPGTLGENWRWRLVPGQFTDERADYLSWLVDTFGRF